MFKLTLVQATLLLTAACVFCGSSPKSVQRKYCVSSNENRSYCGNDSVCVECKLLEEYLSGDSSNDYSFFSFYPGTHNLSRPWNITDVHNITLAPMERRNVIIKCTSENAGLWFVNVTGLTMQGIQMSHCGVATNIDGHSVNSALIFHGGKDLKLQELHISSSHVAGMSVHDVTGSIYIDSCLFTDAYVTEDYFKVGNFIGCNNYTKSSVIRISNTRFENNIYSHVSYSNCKIGDLRLSLGLSIILRVRNVVINLSNVTLRKNGGCAGGNLAVIFFDTNKLVNSTSITVDNNSIIESGRANVGGGMFVTMVNSKESSSSNNMSVNSNPLPLLTIRNTNISNNSANYVGGGIYLKQIETYRYIKPGVVKIENCSFTKNCLNGNGSGGLALHFTTYVVKEYKTKVRPQLKVFVSFCNFSRHDGPPKLGNAVILVKTSPYFSISDINITENNCTGLLAISSNLVISNNVNISYNRAFKGGGMLLCSGAVIYLNKPVSLQITHNEVEHTGGGINIEMECVINKPRCFFQFHYELSTNQSLEKMITVKDNGAKYAGDNIFGGHISTCYLIYAEDKSIDAKDVYREIFDTPNNSLIIKNTPNSSVASSPSEVCLFNQNSGRKNCSFGEREIYPGELLSIPLIIVGQHYGLVPGTVYAELNSSHGEQFLSKSATVQTVKTRASQNLDYIIYSTKEDVTAKLQLTVEEIGANPNAKRLEVSINIKKCPVGFTLQASNSCGCDTLKKLVHHRSKISCYITRYIGIKYDPPFWIGLVENGSEGNLSIAVSQTCPHDYCGMTKVFLNLTNLIVDSEVQCYFNRVGVLCGGCTNGSSLILGSSECSEHCTDYYLFLLIVFAFAGIALVFIITFLNLTVTIGTINGLIFYANIIQIYAFYMFEENKGFIPSFLRIFIAWLNLDFGFRVCFFRGMDGFSKALLQFVFPVYIWMIAGTIIILSNKYAIAMKIFGKNSVKVLATLILLSYTKIIRAAMDALHFTPLYLPGQQHGVIHWSIDGRLKYFDGKHIPVFIVGLIFATVCLPFMVTLLCIRHIGLLSNWPFFSWIYKLKPFFDSYTGPFTDERRFWIGLLLLARIFILGIYSFNKTNSDMAVMATTILVCFILLLIAMLFPKGVYSKHGSNVLEYFSIVNLGFLFLGLICSKYYENRASLVYVVNISIGTAFLVFLLIVIYHTLLKFKCFEILKRLWLKKSHSYVESLNTMRHPPFLDEDQPLLAE